MSQASHAVEICKQPELAAEVTITRSRKGWAWMRPSFRRPAAAAGADGLDSSFRPARGRWCIILCGPPLTLQHCARTAPAIWHTWPRQSKSSCTLAPAGIIGFCGGALHAASYMIDGGGSRKLHSHQADDVLGHQCVAQPFGQDRGGADGVLPPSGGCRRGCDSDLRQLVGSLGLADYRDYAFEASQRLIHSVQQMGVPVIYFGVETGPC